MQVKEIEKRLSDYIDSKEVYNHKDNALKEFDKIRETCSLDDVSNISFIIQDYPDYDHYLFKLTDKTFFLKFGLSKDYLKSLSKKDIHKLAKGLHKFFGRFRLTEGK